MCDCEPPKTEQPTKARRPPNVIYVADNNTDEVIRIEDGHERNISNLKRTFSRVTPRK